MRERIVVASVAVCAILAFGSALAGATETIQNPDEPRVTAEIKAAAGVPPNSVFYRVKRAVEWLQLLLARSEERRAVLQARFAVKRAAEAAVMEEAGREGLASRAAAEYARSMAAATAHLHRAADAAEGPLGAETTVIDAYQRSSEILTVVLAGAPDSARPALEQALANQEESLAAVLEFHAAKQAYLDLKQTMDNARRALSRARLSRNAAATLAAEVALRAAELRTGELAILKDVLEQVRRSANERLDRGLNEIRSAADQFQGPPGQGGKSSATRGERKGEDPAGHGSRPGAGPEEKLGNGTGGKPGKAGANPQGPPKEKGKP